MSSISMAWRITVLPAWTVTDGKVVEALVPIRDSEPDTLAASAPTLTPGRYQLHWRAKSVPDGDVFEGFDISPIFSTRTTHIDKVAMSLRRAVGYVLLACLLTVAAWVWVASPYEAPRFPSECRAFGSLIS
jgi:hypothetical protein